MRPIAAVEAQFADMGRFRDPSPAKLFTLARRENLTDYLLAELVHTVKNDTHFIAPFDGETGEGKSYSAMRILAKDRWLKYHIKKSITRTIITWSPIQTVAKSWKGVFKTGDNILQDEHRKKRVGKGSATADAGLEGLEQTSFRFDQNSILFCSPGEHTHRHHFALEAMGWEKELAVNGRLLRNVNTLMIRGPKFNLPMGMIYLDEDEWPLDPYILNEHVKAEREWKLLVKRFGGTPPEVDPDVIEFVETKLMEYLEQHYPKDMYELSRLELERIYMVELQLPALFFLDQVIAGVRAKLKKKEREYNAQEFVDKQAAHEEFVHEQMALIDIIVPKFIKYFRQYTTEEKMQFPNSGACRDYLRKSTNLDPSFFSKCIDRARHLWLRMKSGVGSIEEVRSIVEIPPPMKAGEFIADIDDPFWLKFVKEKFPKLVKPEYFSAYQNYQDQKKGWTSHKKVGKSMQPQKAKSSVTEIFGKIEGAMKREMGYEFERVLANIYNECPMVLNISPELESFKGAKKGEVDLVAYLIDGQIRIVSIKSHNENKSIGVKKTSPEVKMLLELQAKGTDSHMVVEGLFEDRFFSVPYDPETTKKSVRIRDSDMISWPPDLEKILSETVRPLAKPPRVFPRGIGTVSDGLEGGRKGAKN